MPLANSNMNSWYRARARISCLLPVVCTNVSRTFELEWGSENICTGLTDDADA